MKEQYRKITEAEFRNIFGIDLKRPKKSSEAAILKHVKKYYPAGGVRALLQFSNEYDDERYSSSLGYLGVYDKNGDEILPLKATARDCRAEWKYISIGANNDSEPLDDMVILLSDEVPDLYVKIGASHWEQDEQST